MKRHLLVTNDFPPKVGGDSELLMGTLAQASFRPICCTDYSAPRSRAMGSDPALQNSER